MSKKEKRVRKIYDLCRRRKCCPLALAMGYGPGGPDISNLPNPCFAAEELGIDEDDADRVAVLWDSKHRTESVKRALSIGLFKSIK